jgi:hypothetical protein
MPGSEGIEQVPRSTQTSGEISKGQRSVQLMQCKVVRGETLLTKFAPKNIDGIVPPASQLGKTHMGHEE